MLAHTAFAMFDEIVLYIQIFHLLFTFIDTWKHMEIGVLHTVMWVHHNLSNLPLRFTLVQTQWTAWV
jgi:uncharacterized protein Usg